MSRPRDEDFDEDFEDDEHDEHDNMQLETSWVQKLIAAPFLLMLLVVGIVLGTVPLMFIGTMILRLIAPDTR